jgi:hypothetical protein
LFSGYYLNFMSSYAAATVPKSTAVAPLNPLPVIVIEDPPVEDPFMGLTAVIIG